MCGKSCRARRAMLYNFKNVFLFLHMLTCSFRRCMITGKRTTFTQCINPPPNIYYPEFWAQETVDGILQQQQWLYHRRSRKRRAYQHIRHLWRRATFFTALLQCHYQQSQRPTDVSADSHASDSGAVRREGRTILGAKSKLLCSEIALSRKLFRIRHIHIYIFCFEWPILWPPRILAILMEQPV
jgi:hypothetical protein